MKSFIIEVFDKVLSLKKVNIEVIKKYFSSEYIQNVDGKELDFEDFIEHIFKLKEVVENIDIKFINIAHEGDLVFTNHIAKVQKKDGSYLEVKVLAQFIIKNHKIISCDELTYLLSGDKSNENLGSIK